MKKQLTIPYRNMESENNYKKKKNNRPKDYVPPKFLCILKVPSRTHVR